MAYGNRPEACQHCPANSWSIGWVPPTGPGTDGLVLVGQGPGQQEAWNGVPFYPHAPIGERLMKWFYRSGNSRTHNTFGNLVQCWLPKSKKNGVGTGNREPTQAEIQFCWNAHVGPWLKYGDIATDPEKVRVVVPVGIPAAKWLLGISPKKGAEKFIGTMNEVELPPVGKNNG